MTKVNGISTKNDRSENNISTGTTRNVNLFSQVRLIDAGFLWTEPHSKRIKMKVTIQKEVRKQWKWEVWGSSILTNGEKK